MKNLSFLFLLLFSSNLFADQCTATIEAYIRGIMLPVENEKYISQDRIDWAVGEANRISSMRQTMPDCEVQKRTSIFIRSGEAVEQANRQVEELKSLKQQQNRKSTSQKKQLYERRY